MDRRDRERSGPAGQGQQRWDPADLGPARLAPAGNAAGGHQIVLPPPVTRRPGTTRLPRCPVTQPAHDLSTFEAGQRTKLPSVYLAARGSPLWPNEMTAIGTICLALVTLAAIIVTVVITRQDRQNTVSDALAERNAADDRLNRQIAVSATQLQSEREASDQRLQRQLDAAEAQAQAERDAACEREQLMGAYAVQVTPARMDPKNYGSQIMTSDPKDPITCPCVFITNTGHYTITDVQAQFSPDGKSLVGYEDRVHISSWAMLPPKLVHSFGLSAPERNIRNDTLTPADMGLLFVSDAMAESKIFGCYPVVRWRDQWGQRWEHKLGVVRKITENERWNE